MNHEMDPGLRKTARELSGRIPTPGPEQLDRSKRRVLQWYAETAAEIGWSVLTTPMGSLFFAASYQGLVQVSFTEEEAAFLRELDPRCRLLRDPTWLAPYRDQLEGYFEGKLPEFNLKVDTSGMTDFQRQVLTTIQAIPLGEVWTYAQVASAVNSPSAARAVGQALARNPIPIVLPCHRVIASDGSLGGYAGGLERKRRLLQLENALGSA